MNRKERRAASKGRSASTPATTSDLGQEPSHDRQVREAHQLHQAGRYEQATALCREVLRRAPQNAPALNLLAALRFQSGAIAEAIGLFQRATESDPVSSEYLENLGMALRHAGRHDDAADAFARAVARDPTAAKAAFGLADCYRTLGRMTEAESVYRQLITRQPNDPRPLIGLAGVLVAVGKVAEGIETYRRANSVAPATPETLVDIGNALRRLERPQEAIASYREALALRPGFALAHNNLGNTYTELDRPREAISHFRAALARDPGAALIHFNLARAFFAAGDTSDALEAFQRAASIDPDMTAAHGRLAALFRDRGMIHEAVESTRKARALAPNAREYASDLLFMLNYVPDLPAAVMRADQAAYDRDFGRPARPAARAHQNAPDPERRLRIGYVSPDFRSHSARFYIEPLLAAHDRDAVAIHCYAEVKEPDTFTERCRALTDVWYDTVNSDDEILAERIRADEIDILIDFAGHTGNNRLPVFGHRPAPIQASWMMGFANSTGMTAVDYFITDGVSVTPEEDHHFSETVWRLPNCCVCYRPPEDMPGLAPPPVLETGRITFGSFSRPIRINDRVVAVWSEILHRVSGSRLVLNSWPYLDGGTQALYRERFARHGIGADQVSFIYTSPQPRTWAAYNEIDISLDPFPHSAGVTSAESIWMGLPVVTLRGPPSYGRIAATFLETIGLPDLVAQSTEDYARIAAELANDPDRLAHIRSGMRARAQASSWTDAAAFARDLEDAYRQMWRRWCASQG